MFKIAPIQDRDTQKKYANMCGTEIIDGHFGYAMTDAETGALMGFSQFEILGEYGLITDIRPVESDEYDFEAMFILGRATMNFIDLCGAHIAKALPSSGYDKLLHAIGFKAKDGDLLVCDMTGMFDSHCDGETVKLDK